MVASDRAFRALARAEPEVVFELVRVAAPGLLEGKRIQASSVEDPKLDLPPPIEADLVARMEDANIFHVEGQGYREGGFGERTFRYHSAIVLRHPGKTVTTVAIWLTRPPDHQRLDRIEHSGVTIEVTSIVLAEVSAERLLARTDAVCFAPGADAGAMTDAELCRATARALRESNAGWQRLLLSVTAAATAGRYDAMIEAMQQEDVEPPIIEDLVRYGRDRGFRDGVEVGRREGVEVGRREGMDAGVVQGRTEEARALLFEVLAGRALAVSATQRADIDAETRLDVLHAWVRRALTAASTDEVLADR